MRILVVWEIPPDGVVLRLGDAARMAITLRGLFPRHDLRGLFPRHDLRGLFPRHDLRGPMADDDQFGDFELAALASRGGSFVDAVAAQLGYVVSAPDGAEGALEGVRGSVVVFAYEPGRILHAKLGIEDPLTEEQHELYFDVEGETATFGSKVPEDDPVLLALLTRALRDGNDAARISRRAFRFASFDDVLAALEEDSEQSFTALSEALKAERATFVDFVPSLLATLQKARASQPSTQRSRLLSGARWLLASLERPEALVAYAHAVTDEDERVRRDAIISLGSLAKRPSAAAFLASSGEAAKLVAALDAYLVKFLMVDPASLQKSAVSARTQLATFVSQ